MFKKIKSSVLVVLIGSLAACSSLKDTAYLNSQNGRPLVVTPPQTKRYITNHYILPKVAPVVKQPSLLPPGM